MSNQEQYAILAMDRHGDNDTLKNAFGRVVTFRHPWDAVRVIELLGILHVPCADYARKKTERKYWFMGIFVDQTSKLEYSVIPV